MKFGSLVALAMAVSLPALSSGLFFGVTFTSTTGATLLALTPTAVAGVAAIGAAGAGLAALALPALLGGGPAPKGKGKGKAQMVKVQGKTKHRYRGRRQANAEPVVSANALYEKIFADLAEQNMVGCFQRLVCDISARPDGFAEDIPILQGLAFSEQLEMSNGARHVSRQLLKAMQFGAELKDISECEGFFSQCKWTGTQLDLIVQDMKSRV